MSQQVFVTGMLRSGTTLVQTLLTNHPRAFVAYQPFHQLHVDVKEVFLSSRGIKRNLPLGDGMDESPVEASQFRDWLMTHRFSDAEAQSLADHATVAKGGGGSEFAGRLSARAGTFFQIRENLLGQVAEYFGQAQTPVVGAKEVLCEEYVAAMCDADVKCVIVLRDPRAVIASANQGSYRESVGDRYPLLMLVRLWRKSVAHCLALQRVPGVSVVRYEDLVANPFDELRKLTTWLEIEEFPAGVVSGPLTDHAGEPWRGNSSFGTKAGVDDTSSTAWRQRLAVGESQFIEACTVAELRSFGFEATLGEDEARNAIENFREDESQVRPAYLRTYALTGASREREVERIRYWHALPGRYCRERTDY